MSRLKYIHDFANRWYEKFGNPKTKFIDLVGRRMGEECKNLGFEMDIGKAFFSKYGNAVSNYIELNKVIDEIDDIDLLGSAIFSHWRYFNHWAYDAEEIMEFENISWFLIALSRLAVLSGKDSFVFEGIPKNISLVSNYAFSESHYDISNEVKQVLNINYDGQLEFSAFNIVGDMTREKMLIVEQSKVELILNNIAKYLQGDFEEVTESNIDSWQMKITNTDGEVYNYSSSLFENMVINGNDLSNQIRELYEIDD